MLAVVMRVEWRSLRRERSFWLIAMALAAAIGFAALGTRLEIRAEAARAALIAQQAASHHSELAEQAHAIEQGAALRPSTDPTSPLAVGRELARPAQLPLAPLSPLAVGQRDVLPESVMLTTRARTVHASEGETLSPAERASGPFDLSFVLVFLLPLVIIATTFDLLSSERERGTLALVLSQPISLTTFTLGKAAVRVGLLLLLAITLALAGAGLAGARFTSAGGAGAAALAVLLLASYTLFWSALALAVNAWGRSSPANALALVGCWLAFTIIVPGFAGIAVESAHPPPSRVELVNRARDAAKDAQSRATELEGDHGKPAADATASKAIRVQAELERQLEPVLADFQDRLSAQQALVDKLRFASPALLVNEGLADLAGSGVTRHQHFLEQVERHQAELKTFFHTRAEAGQPLRAADYEAIPRFRHVEPAFGGLAGRVVAAVLAMVAMSLLLGWIAVAGLRAHLSRGFR